MSLFLQLRNARTLQGFVKLQRAASSSAVKGATLSYERDPQPHFTDKETQTLLKSMTQLQVNKVFRKRPVPDNSTEIRFMTTEQLEEEFVSTIEKSQRLLQMPPVVKVKVDSPRIISKDGALTGFSDTKYIFTDITYGVRLSDRKVVVRDTDGTLSYAPLATAKRMNQLYFPLEGRKMHTPRMFAEPAELQRCLDEHKYEFILDRLTVQYEPFEQEFHDISAQVYQHLNDSKQFDALRSTRHFGPMAFFYAWHRCIDDLLYDMIQRDYLQNAVELIALSFKLHNVPVEYKQILAKLAQLQPTPAERALQELRAGLRNKQESDIGRDIQVAIGKNAQDFETDDICLQFIEAYIASEHALKKVQLELAVQTLKEINAEKRQLFEGLRKAHGVQAS